MEKPQHHTHATLKVAHKILIIISVLSANTLSLQIAFPTFPVSEVRL